MEQYTIEWEENMLACHSTRRLVFDVLKLTEARDPLDALDDIAIVHRIVQGRVDRLLMREAAEGIDVIDGSKPATGEELSRLAEGGE